MDDAQDLDGIADDPVDDAIGIAGYHPLARAGDAPLPPQERELYQAVRGGDNNPDDPIGAIRVGVTVGVDRYI